MEGGGGGGWIRFVRFAGLDESSFWDRPATRRNNAKVRGLVNGCSFLLFVFERGASLVLGPFEVKGGQG